MAEEDPDRWHFAGLLKAFREARGLSRAELGALAGYAESTIKSFAVRDTTDRAGTALTFPVGAWRTLLAQVRAS